MSDKRERCKEQVWQNGCFRTSRCSRYAVKDGYCKQHHPDSVKARREESERKHQERQANSPLGMARKAIEEQKTKIEQLETSLKAAEEELERVKGESGISESFSDYIFSIMNPEFSEFADPQGKIEAEAIRKIMAIGIRRAVEKVDFACWSDNPESIVRAYSEALLIFAEKLEPPKEGIYK